MCKVKVVPCWYTVADTTNIELHLISRSCFYFRFRDVVGSVSGVRPGGGGG